jgi:ATP-dependent 26S proteasome regulatory subunit
MLIIPRNVVRFSLRDLEKDYEKTEDDLKAVQSVGQIIAEILKQLDDDRCVLVHDKCLRIVLI